MLHFIMIPEPASTMNSDECFKLFIGSKTDDVDMDLHQSQVFASQEHALEFIDSWSQRNFSLLAKVKYYIGIFA